jgi:hypothetical protein
MRWLNCGFKSCLSITELIQCHNTVDGAKCETSVASDRTEAESFFHMFMWHAVVNQGSIPDEPLLVYYWAGFSHSTDVALALIVRASAYSG